MKKENYHDSSMITSTEYDDETQVLEVTFNNDDIYAYYDFSSSEYDAMMEASSIGKFFNQYVKNEYDWDPLDQ